MSSQCLRHHYFSIVRADCKIIAEKAYYNHGAPRRMKKYFNKKPPGPYYDTIAENICRPERIDYYPTRSSETGEVILSVIVPVHNENEVLPLLHKRLCQVLEDLIFYCEVIYIDDGSQDRSWQTINFLPSFNGDQVNLMLSRNFGKEAAMCAGLTHSRGKAVIIIDADLQDPPELIPAMVAEWQKGIDVINMRRKKRHGESWFKRSSAAVFYRLMNWISEVPIPENVGDFRLLSRKVVNQINALPERNRFMKGIFAWPGFSQVQLEFDREPRFSGKTKWKVGNLFCLAMDGITAFSIRPLRLATWCGGLTGGAAIIYCIWIVMKTLVYGDPVQGYPSTMAVQLLLGGAQLLALGLMGEYLGRIFIEVKQRPLYLIQETRIKKVSRQKGGHS